MYVVIMIIIAQVVGNLFQFANIRRSFSNIFRDALIKLHFS